MKNRKNRNFNAFSFKGGFWEDPGAVLGGFWEDFERILEGFGQDCKGLERILEGF